MHYPNCCEFHRKGGQRALFCGTDRDVAAPFTKPAASDDRAALVEEARRYVESQRIPTEWPASSTHSRNVLGADLVERLASALSPRLTESDGRGGVNVGPRHVDDGSHCGDQRCQRAHRITLPPSKDQLRQAEMLLQPSIVSLATEHRNQGLTADLIHGMEATLERALRSLVREGRLPDLDWPPIQAIVNVHERSIVFVFGARS